MQTHIPAEKRRCSLAAPQALLLATVVAVGAAAGYAGSRVPSTPAIAAEVETRGAARPVGFADIVERVKPAVFGVRVKIEPTGGSGATSPNGPLDKFFQEFGLNPHDEPEQGRAPRRHVEVAQGSGFFISADGYAVTNNHVVEQGQTADITTDDGKTYTARVVGADARSDLALIKIDGRNDFPYVRLADGAPRVGDWVLAVGNPFGLGGTVTAGIVSARGRDIGAGPADDFLQIDAPVNQGNSGGPTFDVDGKVIGVNTAIFSPSGGSIGIAFAVPAETVKNVVAQLRDKGSVVRGWVGVQIQPVTADIAESLGLKKAEGVLVAEPIADGPAAKAGIAAGDVVTSLNAEPVKDPRELSRKIGDTPPGTQIKLGVMRQGQQKTIAVTLGELPGPSPRASVEPAAKEPRGAKADLGLTLAPAGKVEGAGEHGVVVVEADPNGSAAGQGIETGDVILEVAGRAVASPAEVAKAVADARRTGKNTVLMRLRSGETSRFVAVPVG